MTSTREKLALGLEALLPAAQWATCENYAALSASWYDQRELPSEATILAAFVDAKRRSLAKEIKQAFELAKAQPITVSLQGTERSVPADPATLADLLGELSAMQPSDTADWRMLDGARLTLAQSDLLAIRDAIRQRTKTLSTQTNDLADSILTGTRPAQVDVINFGLDWDAVQEVTL